MTTAELVPCANCNHPKWRHRNGRGRCGKQAHAYENDCYCLRYRRATIPQALPVEQKEEHDGSFQRISP